MRMQEDVAAVEMGRLCAESDIRRAVEIGQFVKDKAAEFMKEVADVLAGPQFLSKPVSKECPADKMKQEAAQHACA